MTKRHNLTVIMGAVVSVCAAAIWPAHAAYPTRPVEIIVPYAPGGSTDQVARLVGLHMGKLLGQPVVVVNKPGANGAIGASAAARAPADGYTLLLGNTGLVMNPIMNKNLPYKPERDFTPIGMVTEFPLVMVATPSLKMKTVKEFVDYAKSRQDQVSFASAGLGNSTHLAGEVFKKAAGLERMAHVPYTGSSPGLSAVAGGSVQVFFDTSITALPLVAGGRLTALAVTSQERLRVLPNVPTMAEAGYGEFGKLGPWSWMGVFAPAKTQPEVMEKLRSALNMTLANPEVRRMLENTGAIVFPAGMTGEGAQAFLKSEGQKWARLIKDANVEVE